jgi:hypothetical protein
MALVLVAMASRAVDEATQRMDQRLHRIQQQCGELCNLRRPTIPHASERFAHSKAAVDCGWLLADGTGIDATLEQPWPPEEPPARWLDEFTMHGRFPLVNDYLNVSGEAQAGSALRTETLRNGNVVTMGWSRQRIDGLVRQAQGSTYSSDRKRVTHNVTNTSLGRAFWTRYSHLNRELWPGLHRAIHGSGAPFTGRATSKNVLVIGSQTPWVEGLCLAAGAGHVFTLEYGKLATDHPDVTVLTPEEFLARGRAGTLKIDVVVTASSLEHAGLGRYGDGLNPWGDILALARAWCVSSAHARLVIAVPTSRAARGREAETEAQAKKWGQDVLGWNSGRTYGPVRYPYLTTNWRFDTRIFAETTPGWAQTVYTFTKRAHEPAGTSK